MNKVLSNLEGAKYVVDEIKKGERIRKAPIPFTTSTLQQEASKALNYSTRKTMQLAQQLYEGVDVKGHGTIGLITYLRTDSTRISDEADKAVKEYINSNYGEEFVSKNNIVTPSGKKVQDAHEAIRPTYVEISPALVKNALTRDAFRLYQLIWKRFVASRMEPARYETNSLKVKANAYQFSAATSNLVFEGFMKVYIPEEEEEKSAASFGDLKKGDNLELSELNKSQHFTQPPEIGRASCRERV